MNNLKKWIGYYEDIIPKNKCQDIIKFAKNSLGTLFSPFKYY